MVFSAPLFVFRTTNGNSLPLWERFRSVRSAAVHKTRRVA